MKYLRLAFSLLTILPAGSISEPLEPGDAGRAGIWYPLVGLVIGVLAGVGWWIFHLLFPAWLTACLTLALWVLITGGLHLDGLADCCDGLLFAASPERRLEIMADAHIGTFGMLGLILSLMLKLTALYALPSASFIFILILSTTFSRWLVLIAGKQPLARSTGMAVDFAAGLSDKTIPVAAILPMLLMVFGGWQAALSAGLAALAAAGILAFARSRIGGITGDVFGLTIEMAELMILLTYAAF
jgi:adenosylcobinamide-GDP ribazoletransferase